eukprot:TRINITY_DN28501_c0_g1_i1.p1 TRINITY_DN28501_c0_g1~~TRINITY_DN28501_c0_g1_i1.p1  ORF type:complete len:693 (-),score=102.40 TRINITY_DN28501_c0_g1_i1:185-2065(-)
MKVMEQNKAKPSKWADMAKKGSKITWLLAGNSPAHWGRVVNGAVDCLGHAISSESEEPVKKRPAAAEDSAKEDDGTKPAAKKAKVEPVSTKKAAVDAPKAHAAATSSSDTLGLKALFEGGGHGAAWDAVLRPILEGLPQAAKYIGPGRDKRMVPVRELTFQALKPNPPAGWRVVSFGQSPFPRIESATGIAHFDNAVTSWEDGRFGAVTTMRCIIKAAAMNKYKVGKDTTTAKLRSLMKEHDCVGPAEWFQAMLTQGVLFMNAACTLLPPEDKSVRAGEVVKEHRKFWQPVIEAIVDAILSECGRSGTGIVFSWWGAESLETKRMLEKSCFKKHVGVNIKHIDHKNPAAMGDAFCDNPNIFATINKALKALGRGEIDWLPSHGWKDALFAGTGTADAMGDFIAETQALHKMYLERLKDGLDKTLDDLPDINGIMATPLVGLSVALKSLSLTKQASASLEKAKTMSIDKLSIDEAAAVHMYTTNHLYKALNEALRSNDRSKVQVYFQYLRLLLTAFAKMPVSKKMLYRGVALDLSKDYQKNQVVTWWAVSSCTPELKVAKSFSGSGTSSLFLIKPLTSVGIKHLSEYKNEEEFILSPGTQFKVTDVKRIGKLVEIHLAELNGAKRVQ